MNANFLLAIPGAATVTALIVLAMHGLIALQPMTLEERTRVKLPPFVMRPTDENLLVDDWRPEPIPEPVQTPMQNPIQDTDSHGSRIAIPRHSPTPRSGTSLQLNALSQDGPLVAIVRVQPSYPSGPAQRGIEGWVTVQFDVLPDGSVSNVEVLESSSRVFERAAVQAASRFRYKAKVVNGEPQLTSGVRYRFRFELD